MLISGHRPRWEQIIKYSVHSHLYGTSSSCRAPGVHTLSSVRVQREVVKVKPVTRTKATDGQLLEAVDDTLKELLSEQFRTVFYDYMRTAFSLPRNSIPKRLDDFQSALTKTLGDTGRAVLEKAIAKRLYSKLGLSFTERPGCTLLQYVEEAEGNLQNL
jgi:hypothetical protein